MSPMHWLFTALASPMPWLFTTTVSSMHRSNKICVDSTNDGLSSLTNILAAYCPHECSLVCVLVEVLFQFLLRL